MLSFQSDPTIVLEASTSQVRAVAFYPNGKYVLGGGNDGLRRWRLEDGQEVGKHTGMVLHAISMSRDHKWIVCGSEEGASVWGAEMQGQVVAVEGRDRVMTVDVSPDSTTFATGTDDGMSVWHITTGERLVGPLRHDGYVNAIRFSPNGERIATSTYGGSILVFDSRNGDKLITIQTATSTGWPSTALAWSNDSQQIFAASNDKKIRSFDVSTGSQLAESQTLNGGNVNSIALAANGKFLATCAGSTILFLDTSTLSLIDAAIEDGTWIWAIAIAPDDGCLAAGRRDGKITLRDLGSILPDPYGPFHVSTFPFTILACLASPIPSPTLTHCIRHLIARNDNQTSRRNVRNPTHPSPRLTAKTVMLVSSRYPFVVLPSQRVLTIVQVVAPSGAPAAEFNYDEVGDQYNTIFFPNCVDTAGVIISRILSPL